MITTCAVCSGPYLAVSDDPSPAHPGCAPADRGRYESATSGPRTYRGLMPAVHEAGCRGCSGRVAVGDEVVLADVDGTRAWVHLSCEPEQSVATTPHDALSGPVRVQTALPRVPGTPAGRSDRPGDDTTAPRRAAA